jgi:Family of unknown function (DUF5999)
VSAPGAWAHAAPDGSLVSGLTEGSSRQAAAGSAVGGRPESCPHALPCPPPEAPGRQAARVIASHPEQGWSLLCNRVVVFDDSGVLLPDGSVIEPDRLGCRPGVTGTPRAGRARTVAPVPAGRAREGGPRRPGPATAGAALVMRPASSAAEGMASGLPQRPARLRGRRVPGHVVPPYRGRLGRMAADAW